jgi:hypothetical protein
MSDRNGYAHQSVDDLLGAVDADLRRQGLGCDTVDTVDSYPPDGVAQPPGATPPGDGARRGRAVPPVSPRDTPDGVTPHPARAPVSAAPTESTVSHANSAVSDFVSLAFERAKKSPPPAAAGRALLPEIKLLITLCRELQRAAEEMQGDRFWLSCRDVGQLFGVSHNTGNRWLRLLVKGRVIALLVRGSKNSGMASQYRYLGGD